MNGEATKKSRPRSLARISCLRSRAIGQEDKQARERDLLNGALRLFGKRDFDAIGILDICKEAGLAKGTLYLYFSSKEEVFLRLTEKLFLQWSEDLRQRLLNLPPATTSTEFADDFVDSVEAEDMDVLLRLLSMLHAVIEKNVATEAIVPFKRRMAQAQEAHVKEYVRIFPGLSLDEIQQFVIFLSVAVLGTWTMAKPPKAALKALEQEGLSFLVPPFGETLKKQIRTYLAGLFKQN